MSRLKMFLAAAGGAIVLAGPALAISEKEQDCTYQADVAGAVQKARLDGVPQKDVTAAIKKAGTTWPERYDNAIPILAAHIYGLKKRQLRKADLRAEFLNTCLTN